jgi:hypothetical protein
MSTFVSTTFGKISGRHGSAVAAIVKKGKNVLKVFTAPFNPKSVKQVAQRTKFKFVITTLLCMNDLFKITFHGLGEFHHAVSLALKPDCIYVLYHKKNENTMTHLHLGLLAYWVINIYLLLFALCSFAFSSLFFALCSLLFALGSRLFALCLMLNVLCSMLNVQCFLLFCFFGQRCVFDRNRNRSGTRLPSR